MAAALVPALGSASANESRPTPLRRLLAALLRRVADRLAPLDAPQVPTASDLVTTVDELDAVGEDSDE